MKKNITKKLHEYATCKIFITNSSRLISDDKAFYFCKEYIEYYLSGEDNYISEPVKNSKTINMEIQNDKYLFKIIVDDNIHFIMNIKGFHNVKTGNLEITSGTHACFFRQILDYNHSGINIIEHYPF